MRKLDIREMDRLSSEQYHEADKLPIVVVLDNLRSMNNVGSIFRTIDSFRLSHLYLCGITPTPPHPDIHKTALGAEEVVEWSYYTDSVECVKDLIDKGYEIWSVEQVTDSVMLHNIEYNHITFHHPIAVVLGNEVKGVEQEIIDLSKGCLEIPQRGTKHSLNVSVAGGIVLWELSKRLF